MDNSTDLSELLEQIMYPAFIVKDGIITDANHMALQRQVEIGTAVGPMLCSGEQEYAEFSQGRLCLTLSVGNITYNTSVVRTGDRDLFYLESEFSDPELRTLAAAAQALRLPLSEALLCADTLADNADTDESRQLQALRRNLHRLHRAICNMSDAASYSSHRSSKIETCDLAAVTDEIMQKAGDLLSKAGKQLDYKRPRQSAYCLADKEKLERAILNLLSNAAKFGNGDTPVRVSVDCDRKRFRFSVCNRTADPDSIVYPTLFSAFRREPGILGGHSGIGLGMTIARNAAAAHGGTLLFDQPEASSVRFTLAIPIQKSKAASLRSPVLYPIDYSGGYDHTLTELSDILPDDLFK